MNKLETLARLPVLLNSSLSLKRVISVAIDHATQCLEAEAATVFLLDDAKKVLSFWAASGEKGASLQDKTMPADKGIVGAVISSGSPEVVNDTSSDSRFFGDVDKESQFQTKRILCAPLSVSGDNKIGAIQLLNKATEFTDEDLDFLVQFSHQLAIAIDNARLHEALQEKTKRLEALTARREEMLSVISHEFRTPLSLIQSSVSMLEADQSDFQKKLHGLLNDGVDRLTRLMKQLGNLKSLSTESFSPKIDTCEISELLKAAHSVVSEGFESRNLEFSLEQVDGQVKADFTLMVIAISNLLANAIRFTEDGGKVTLSASFENKLCRIAVTDTGIGIPADEQKAILEPFYHVANAGYHSSGKYEFMSGGIGLGLSTVNSILSAHDSSLQLSSTPKEGSTFSFHLDQA